MIKHSLYMFYVKSTLVYNVTWACRTRRPLTISHSLPRGPLHGEALAKLLLGTEKQFSMINTHTTDLEPYRKACQASPGLSALQPPPLPPHPDLSGNE